MLPLNSTNGNNISLYGIKINYWTLINKKHKILFLAERVKSFKQEGVLETAIRIMELITPNRNGKFLYDKFNSKVVNSDDLLMINQFHKSDFYFLTLQQYEVSGEWIIWVSCDLFAEFQFDDVWLIFSGTEKLKAEAIFTLLKEKFSKLDKTKTPKQFRFKFYGVIEEIEQENQKLEIPLSA